MKFLFQDWVVNSGSLKSQLLLLAFRMAHYFHRLPCCRRWIGIPVFFFYEAVVVSLLGVEISYKATIGPRLQLFHGGRGTVIHESVLIGKNCILRHGTTLGMKSAAHDVPHLGDDINIGCHSLLIGAIHIGDGVTIGAGSVVLNDVPPHATVVGNPARIVNS